MKNIIILTASFGMGHNSVSNAIKQEIISKNENCQVEIADIYDIINPSIKDFGTNLYNNLSENYTFIYNTLYDYKKYSKNNLIDWFMSMTHYKKLYNYLKTTNPSIVISTFPLCACLMSKVKKHYSLNAKHFTVITDVVDSWEWVYPNTDMYFVPYKEIKSSLVYKGVENDKIEVTGIPVSRNFMNQNKTYLNEKILLIVASGMSEKELSPEFLLRLDEKTSIKAKVVTGRNKTLYNSIANEKYKNIEVLGFVNNMYELMDQALFIITKPGGITLFEAINKELPLVIKDTNIGQEKGNIKFVKNNNLGLVIKDNHDLLNIVSEYTKNPNLALKLSKNINIIKRDLRPYKMVDCILSNA